MEWAGFSFLERHFSWAGCSSMLYGADGDHRKTRRSVSEAEDARLARTRPPAPFWPCVGGLQQGGSLCRTSRAFGRDLRQAPRGRAFGKRRGPRHHVTGQGLEIFAGGDLFRTKKGEASDASHKTLVAPEPDHVASSDGYASSTGVVGTETAISLLERPSRPNLRVPGLYRLADDAAVRWRPGRLPFEAGGRNTLHGDHFRNLSCFGVFHCSSFCSSVHG